MNWAQTAYYVALGAVSAGLLWLAQAMQAGTVPVPVEVQPLLAVLAPVVMFLYNLVAKRVNP